MRVYFLLTSLLLSFFSFGQMPTVGKVYIVEGIVADRETLKIIPSAILYNDSLGIMTTSDERGYYKIVVPYKLIDERKHIPIDVTKTGYKKDGWGIGLNPSTKELSNTVNKDESLIWNFDVQILLLSKSENMLPSTSMAHIPSIEGEHGYRFIKMAFDDAVSSEIRNRKFARLKEGNEKVYFPIDGIAAFATSSYDLFITDKIAYVYIDDKKIMLADINKLVKRSQIVPDDAKSQTLTKKYGKETFAFRTNN